MDADADVVVWTREQAEAAAALDGARVHVKLDTGMGRLGTKDVELARSLLGAHVAGVMTHFATADEPGDELFPRAARALRRVRGGGEATRRPTPSCTRPTARPRSATRPRTSTWSAAASRSTAWTPSRATRRERGLEPALALESWVAALRRFEAGDGAGYGRRWRAREPTWVATVPIGYGDGWRRGLSNDCDVLIGGRRYPVVGTVSMDNITVDVGPDPAVEIGDPVVLIGAPGGGADPRRGGGAQARHDQLRGHLRSLAAGAQAALAVTDPLVEALGDAPAWVVGGTVRDELLGRPVTDVDVAVAGDPESAARALARTLRGPVFRLSERFGAWRALDRRARPDLRRVGAPGRDHRGGPRAARLQRERDGAAGGGRRGDRPGGRARRPRRARAAGFSRASPTRRIRCARCGWRGSRPSSASRPTPATEQLTRDGGPAPGGGLGGARVRRAQAAGGGARRARGRRAGRPARAAARRAARSSTTSTTWSRAATTTSTSTATPSRCWRARSSSRAGSTSCSGSSPRRLRAVLDEPLADDLSRGQAIRLGALLHDVGKPATRGVRPDGRVTFIGHDELGERMVRDLCRRLRTSERLSRFLEGLTRTHLVLGFLVHAAAARPGCGVPLPHRHEPGGGGGHAAVVRRSPGHPRPQGRRGDRGPPGARARADGRGARLARRRAAGAAGARARAGPRAGHRAGARAGAAAARGSRRPPSPARRAIASRRSQLARSLRENPDR